VPRSPSRRRSAAPAGGARRPDRDRPDPVITRRSGPQLFIRHRLAWPGSAYVRRGVRARVDCVEPDAPFVAARDGAS
jgi:hypothetical protein